MVKIWANRLVAGTQVWASVPEKRREDVKAELQARVASGEISQAQYDSIVA